MSLHLLKKTASIYIGFHTVIGDETYLVHPDGTENAPAEVMAQFAALAAVVDLSVIGQHNDPTDNWGDIYVKPAGNLEPGYRTHLNGRLYIVDANAKLDPPQAMIDGYDQFLRSISRPQTDQAQVSAQGEARFEREESVAIPDQPPADPNALQANWDQTPIVEVPNLVARPPDQPIDQTPEGGPDVQIPDLSFTGQVAQPTTEEAEPAQKSQPTKRRGGKSQPADPTTLAPGEQIITSE